MTQPDAPDQDALPVDVAELAAEQKRSELSILKESLDAARAQTAAHYDQLLRLKAEFENFRKRADKEKTDNRRWGKEEIILRLVSLMDVMEQAEKAAHSSTDMKSVVAGLDMLYKEFKRLLKDEGLEEIEANPGDSFDPSTHEAVAAEGDGDGSGPGLISAIIQKGYKFGGALLRPSRVRVTHSAQKKETR
jgi:molecular chaperone GrpE